jgi:hypothetical protein
MSRRLTKRELNAIQDALNQCLAGEVLDGYEGEDDEEDVRAAMESALSKVQDRL